MLVRRDASCWCLHTPAKLNLFLEVLGKRSDGYHELETLMAPVDICDTLIFSATEAEEISLSANWAPGWNGWASAEARAGKERPLAELPPNDENLAYKALRLLQQRHGVKCGARVELIKRIPAAAGLGGASSDGAAALVAGNLMWQLGLSGGELHSLAAALGSDVPFFLQGGAAVCRGRGEAIEPLAGTPPLAVVVVRPPVGLSTAEVYRHCRPAAEPRRVEPLLATLRQGATTQLRETMFNRLQEAARELSPWIDRLQHEFEQLDCPAHQMTGSGSSYFGICRSRRQAVRVARQLRARRLGSVYCAALRPATGREILPTIA